MEETLTNCTGVAPIFRPDVVLAQKLTVSITCILSLLGAGLIIFTYVAFKDLRTGARQILVQLSIADIIVAASHVFGVLYNLPQYIRYDKNCAPVQNEGRNNLSCEIQAGITMFGAIATYLWTLAMAIYLLVIIVLERKRIGKRLRLAFYPICWGIPLTVVIVIGSLDYLGFDDSLDIGWCYLTWVSENDTSQHRALAPQMFGYALWSYLTYLLLPLLYLWIRCYIRIKLTRVRSRTPSTANSPTKYLLYDVKLTFIPLIFLLLRISSLGLSIPHQYLSFENRLQFRATWWNVILVLTAVSSSLKHYGLYMEKGEAIAIVVGLVEGIGLSAQGLVNAILFCALTKVVRQKLALCLCCHLWKNSSRKVYLLQHTPAASFDKSLEDSVESRINESLKDESKRCLLSESDSRLKYQSINHGVTYSTE